MFNSLKRKDSKVDIVEEGFWFSRGLTGIATHLRDEKDGTVALCGRELVYDDNSVQTIDEVRDTVYNRQHRNFFFCGDCVVLILPELTEDEVINLRYK